MNKLEKIMKIDNEEVRPDGLRQSDVDYLKKQHIHLALPMYDGKVCDSVLIGLMRFVVVAKDLGIEFSIDTLKNDSMITRARNKLIARFMLNKPATHLMFIDSDIVFQSEDIIRLCLQRVDVLGGIYPLKKIPIDYVFNPTPNPITRGDLIEVNHVGTGFMMIKKTAIETLINAHPELKYDDQLSSEEEKQYTYALFENSIDSDGKYLTEDWTFCKYWKETGGSIFADVGVDLGHIGTVTFPSNPEHLMAVIKARLSAMSGGDPGEVFYQGEEEK